MCKVYTGYCGTSEIEHGLCTCTVDNPLAKARGLSLRTGAQTMLYLSHKAQSKINRSVCYVLLRVLTVNGFNFIKSNSVDISNYFYPFLHWINIKEEKF